MNEKKIYVMEDNAKHIYATIKKKEEWFNEIKDIVLKEMINIDKDMIATRNPNKPFFRLISIKEALNNFRPATKDERFMYYMKGPRVLIEEDK